MPKPSTSPGNSKGKAPAITGFSADTGILGDNITSDQTLTLFGTSSPDDLVTIVLDGVEVDTVTADTDGNWRYETPTLDEGPHVFEATSIHANRMLISDPVTIEIDSTAPVVTVDALTGDNILDDSEDGAVRLSGGTSGVEDGQVV
ncbi:Ig-like domain-containing protein, partial [Aestuariicoccus sp. MJ-SS9]|uniref:Ig-like domain-containing protein n=1 Tax=Aestuariicoccus sp. MJ-SS9 TaxID=3079855 RepID=UPI002914A9EA